MVMQSFVFFQNPKVVNFLGLEFILTHFQGTGGWYIENSLTTLGQKDPVSEHNSELWNSGSDAKQRDCS